MSNPSSTPSLAKFVEDFSIWKLKEKRATPNSFEIMNLKFPFLEHYGGRQNIGH